MADDALGNLIVLLSIDGELRARFQQDPEAVMEERGLSEAGKLAIRLQSEECVKVLANVNNQVAHPGLITDPCSEAALRAAYAKKTKA
jgi:hypothetical protein